MELEEHGRVPRRARAPAVDQRRLHGRSLGAAPRRDGHRRHSTGGNRRRGGRRCAACCATGSTAGAIGFSSSWSTTHNDTEQNMVPSRYAERSELDQPVRGAGRLPRHVARVHSLHRALRRRRRPSHGRHVGCRGCNAQLERAGGDRSHPRRRHRPSSRQATWPRAGRQGRRARLHRCRSISG